MRRTAHIEDTRFAKQLGWIIAFKLMALFVLWFFFFSGDHRMHIDPDQMTRQITGYTLSSPSQPMSHP